MDRNSLRGFMWAEACDMLLRAERLHRQFFWPLHSGSRRLMWEPPVDVLETEEEVLVLVALPGVAEHTVEIVLEESELVFAGVRAFPQLLGTALVHRLELPQGRFERRVRLPPGGYGNLRRSFADGLLLVALQKEGASRG